jgi:hypothetical protein
MDGVVHGNTELEAAELALTAFRTARREAGGVVRVSRSLE